MPPAIAAIAVPLVLGAATMVSQNVQNKAAIKNNETQQASNLANAQGAWNTAKTNTDNWLTANPSPNGTANKGVPAPNLGSGIAAPQGQNNQTNIGSLLQSLPPQYQQLLKQLPGAINPASVTTPSPQPPAPSV